MIPEPHLLLKLFVAWPVIFFVYFVSCEFAHFFLSRFNNNFADIPWFSAVWLMMYETDMLKDNLNALESVVVWFATPERVFYHALSRIVRALVTPLLQLALGILVKRMFGLNKATSIYSQPSQLALLRRYINSHTLSKSALRSAFSILGTHYEVVSVRYPSRTIDTSSSHSPYQIVYRAMGAKIGRRVRFAIYCLLVS
jgi:hypothetical protein